MSDVADGHAERPYTGAIIRQVVTQPMFRSESSERLLAESVWLRKLARQLLRDPHLADDAVQSTLAVAIEKPPAAGGRVPSSSTTSREVQLERTRFQDSPARSSPPMRIIVGNSSRDGPRMDLVDGASETITVPDRAETLVLYKAGLEVRRMQVTLQSGIVNELRP